MGSVSSHAILNGIEKGKATLSKALDEIIERIEEETKTADRSRAIKLVEKFIDKNGEGIKALCNVLDSYGASEVDLPKKVFKIFSQIIGLCGEREEYQHYFQNNINSIFIGWKALREGKEASEYFDILKYTVSCHNFDTLGYCSSLWDLICNDLKTIDNLNDNNTGDQFLFGLMLIETSLACNYGRKDAVLSSNLIQIVFQLVKLQIKNGDNQKQQAKNIANLIIKDICNANELQKPMFLGILDIANQLNDEVRKLFFDKIEESYRNYNIPNCSIDYFCSWIDKLFKLPEEKREIAFFEGNPIKGEKRNDAFNIDIQGFYQLLTLLFMKDDTFLHLLIPKLLIIIFQFKFNSDLILKSNENLEFLFVTFKLDEKKNIEQPAIMTAWLELFEFICTISPLFLAFIKTKNNFVDILDHIIEKNEQFCPPCLVAVRILFYFAQVNGKEKLVESGYLQRLAKFMLIHKEPVPIWLDWIATYNMIEDCKDTSIACAFASFPQSTSGLMISALANRVGYETSKRFGEEGAIETIIEAIKLRQSDPGPYANNKKQLEETFGMLISALGELSKCCKPNAKKVVSMGGIDLILKIMEDYSEDDEPGWNSLHSLAYIAGIKRKYQKEIVEKGGLEIIRKYVQKHHQTGLDTYMKMFDCISIDPIAIEFLLKGECTKQGFGKDYYMQLFARCATCEAKTKRYSDRHCLICLEMCHKGHVISDLYFEETWCLCTSHQQQQHSKLTIPSNLTELEMASSINVIRWLMENTRLSQQSLNSLVQHTKKTTWNRLITMKEEDLNKIIIRQLDIESILKTINKMLSTKK